MSKMHFRDAWISLGSLWRVFWTFVLYGIIRRDFPSRSLVLSLDLNVPFKGYFDKVKSLKPVYRNPFNLQIEVSLLFRT